MHDDEPLVKPLQKKTSSLGFGRCMPAATMSDRKQSIEHAWMDDDASLITLRRLFRQHIPWQLLATHWTIPS